MTRHGTAAALYSATSPDYNRWVLTGKAASVRPGGPARLARSPSPRDSTVPLALTMTTPELLPYDDRYHPPGPPEVEARAFCERLRRRRSVREYASRPVSREVVEWIVRCAGSAPSGANKQPWRFVAVSDPAVKHRLRLAAEKEEREFYTHRAGEHWLRDLEPLGTSEDKTWLEAVPWLIAVFKLIRGDRGGKVYYPDESVGIALGFLLAAAHHAGLSTLVYTPSPMAFLGRVLDRPEHERPFALVLLGYAADDCRTPAAARTRKPLDEILVLREESRP